MRILALILAVAGLSTELAFAQCGAFQLNTYTTGQQDAVSAAVSPIDGDILVVWESQGSSGGDPFDFSIQGRFSSQQGVPQGSEFVINGATVRRQISPSVAVDPASGRFVVTWLSNEDAANAGALPFHVKARVLDGDGVPITGDIAVDDRSAQDPHVAYELDGGFVVVWEDLEEDPDIFNDVIARRFDADGVPRGSRFVVSAVEDGESVDPRVTVNRSSGDFLVVWREVTSGSDRAMGKRFDSAGQAVGDAFEISSSTSINAVLELWPEYDPSSDTYLVAWSQRDEPGISNEFAVRIRRFDSTGMPMGTEQQVNSIESAQSRSVALAPVPGSGDYWASWWSEDGASFQGRLRRFDSSGTPLGPEMGVHPHANSWVLGPALALVPSPTVLDQWDPFVLWSGRELAMALDARETFGNFVTRTLESGCPLLVDGFESGDAGAWQLVQEN